MGKLKRILFIPGILVWFLLYSCQDDRMQADKYDRPEWLTGKIYTLITEQDELSTFARCLEITGYDTIINISGSYTAFAPSNEAFEAWLSENNYNDVDDIPLIELSRLVKYHLVQNPWSKIQLRSLDVYGWIDTLDNFNNKPRGFKRETLLRDENRKYGIASKGRRIGEDENLIIVDTTSTDFHRRVLTDSRKFAPFFFQEYFDIYDLDAGDYEFYFDRPFNGGDDIYFAGARIEGDEIFAENGFVYVIDKVVEPLENLYQLLEKEYSSYSYSHFLELINQFPDFNYNQQETFRQPGADLGLAVDSLFNLNFTELAFNISGERTQPPRETYGLPQNVTIRYHHGMVAPVNQAFESLINEYINTPGGWGSLERVPEHVKRIIVNSSLSINAVYPTDLEKGFYNGENDILTIDESGIIQKEFGSNSTFIGINQPIVPRAFSSVTGPVYLQPGYEKVMFAIEQARLLPALKRANEDYMFFVESDINTSVDSSLLYDRFNEIFSVYQITGPVGQTKYNLSINDLRTLLLNHIAVRQSDGLARKEFIPNLAGNFIVVNNETGEYSGTGTTTVGYNGLESAANFPVQLSENADNGTTYQIQNWFSFTSPTLFSEISSKYVKFHALLKKAGLSLDREYRYSFISNSNSYTVFIPTDDAIDDAGLNSLPVAELRKVLLTHFVQGDMIFTDGKKESGYYQTARVDEKSTPFSTIFTRLYIQTGTDVIRFRDKDGGDYTQIDESDLTNRFTGYRTNEEDDEVFVSIVTNGVIHSIDKALIKEELDTN
ncbi:MAG: fasciclin domain-containing protein [Bacteroidales bacterium]